jgi:Histidine kinase-, DNA gyrase B-, and HSP90-like ATPase
MDTTPYAQDLWEGIAGHFDSFSQVICEFIDNSISNFEGRNIPNKSVHINLEEVRSNRVKVQLEDNGTGIEDFQPVIRLGDKSPRQTPLNEHGFGLKHALATANPKNNKWKIYTRIAKEFKSNKFRILPAPYSFNMEPITENSNKNHWPGIFNGSGTIVEFECSRTLFDTIQMGIKGRAGFLKCLDYLREELGYLYSGVIEKGRVSITISSQKSGARQPAYSKVVEAVKPDWKGFYQPGSGSEKVDLGGGELQIEYVFGEMGESSYVKHYKRNMSTSGVEIRMNGRLMAANLFKEIWQLENHPTYNHFLAIINLVSGNRDALPQTRTSKNGIRSGDEKLENLFQWIRSTHPTPHKDLSGAVSERELVKELAELKEKHIRSKTKHIEREFKVFTTIGSPVLADLYVYDGSEVVIYEAKKDTADVQNVYQLLMYWDGAVSDGIIPAEGILIASSCSPGVAVMLDLLNSIEDQNGNLYNFSTKTWQDEGIKYPKP